MVRDDSEPSGLAYWARPRQHRRQAQQKNAAPHGRTLSQHRVPHLVTLGPAPSDPNPRLRRVLTRRLSTTSKVAILLPPAA